MSGPKEVRGCVLLQRGPESRPKHAFVTKSEFKTAMDQEPATKLHLSLLPSGTGNIVNYQNVQV